MSETRMCRDMPRRDRLWLLALGVSRITVLSLVFACESRGDQAPMGVRDGSAAGQVKRFLSATDGLAKYRGLRDVVLRSVVDGPQSTAQRWEGVHDGNIFVVVAMPLPRGADVTRLGPAAIKAAGIFALDELLKTDCACEAFQDECLDDRDVLQKALVAAKPSALLRGVTHEEGIAGGYAVGYAVVDAAQIKAMASQQTNRDAVLKAYLRYMHLRVEDLMKSGAYQQALALCVELRGKRLGSADLLLDSAKCLHEMGRSDDAIERIRADLPLFAGQCSASVMEQVGDLALACGAGTIARDAYRLASQKMLEPKTVE